MRNASSEVNPSQLVVIVSGLPRSGTSLMMQMLEAAGVPITSDGARSPDVHNPRGYFEDERVKTLRSEGSWIANTRGTALKVVAPLLPFLPEGEHYRVIWMERDLDEVLASQRHMLEGSGASVADEQEAALRAAFRNQIEQVRADLARRGVPWIAVSHREAISDPMKVLEEIRQFLEIEIDAAAARASVDPSLHRHRIDRTTPD